MNNQPLGDDDIARLQDLLDTVPAPLEPLDPMAIDGYLCGLLLQPQKPPVDVWLPHVFDVDGRPLPADWPSVEARELVLRRHAELDRAIGVRDWFDPWVYALDEDASPSETVQPWVAGFATAMDLFPAAVRADDVALREPLALLYMHFDPDDLEDADELLALIETLEPPSDLGEAVQDMVRSVMLIADVTRPRRAPPKTQRPTRRGPR